MMWVGEKDETAEDGDEDEENREEITKTPGTYEYSQIK